MTLEEFQSKYTELDELEDELTDQLEKNPDDAELGRKVNSIAQERSDLEKAFDDSPPDDETGEEVEEEEAAEETPVEEPEAIRDPRGRFASVPSYQPTPEQKRRDAMAERYPKMV